jgi:hypothetical protein
LDSDSVGLSGPKQIGLSLGLGLPGPKQIGLFLGLGLSGPKQIGLSLGLGLRSPKQIGLRLGLGLPGPRPDRTPKSAPLKSDSGLDSDSVRFLGYVAFSPPPPLQKVCLYPQLQGGWICYLYPQLQDDNCTSREPVFAAGEEDMFSTATKQGPDG